MCEDFILGEEIFELICGDPFLALHDEHFQAGDVAQKTRRVFAAGTEEVLCQLLGDGRSTTGVVMEDILFGDSSKGGVVDAVMGVESFIFGIDEGLPEHGVHLFVSNRRSVLAEKLTDGFSVGAVYDGSLRGTFVLDGGHRG